MVNGLHRTGVSRGMHSTFPGYVRAAVFVAACLAPAATADAQGFMWWKDEAVQRRLSLSVDQSDHLNAIWEQAKPSLRSGMKRLHSAEQELTDLIERSADDGPVVRQLELVEAARGELNKSRTLMLLQMRRLLSPDQRVRLDELHREQPGRGPRKPGTRSTH